MDLFKTILFSIILFSCQEEPETWVQDPELRAYFDTVMDRLENDRFPRNQIALTIKVLPFGMIATTNQNGIVFDQHHWGFSSDTYIELVVLHEVLHACYGWQPETKKEHDRMWIIFGDHTEEEIQNYYDKANIIISEL